jgi:para-aminobenzoate synthetase
MLFWDDYSGGGVLTVSSQAAKITFLTSLTSYQCYSSKDRDLTNLLAKFTPRTSLRRQGQPFEPPTLLVTSVGHDWFDDVLMSALVIERTRTAPS